MPIVKKLKIDSIEKVSSLPVSRMRGPQGEQGFPGQLGTQGPKGEAGVRGHQGLPGKDGVDGKDGIDGAAGLVGSPGEKGDRGEKGERGKEGPRGKDGETRVVQQGGGGHATVKYTNITSATFTITKSSLLHGHNIFGVNYAGDVTITIPNYVDPEMLITINDESGSAGTNNITVTTNS